MDIVGHIQQRALIQAMLESNTLAPSLLFSGIPGVGKKLIACEIASLLLCSHPNTRRLIAPASPCSCPACKVFRAGNAPDFHLVECGNKSETTTDSVRRLLSSLHLKSFGGTAKVVVMNDVEALSAQAINSLLKILEEPRPGLYFILVAGSRTKILPTILSRCLCLHFERLSDAEIMSVLPAQARLAELDITKLPKSISLAELASLADGSFENIEKIVEHLEDWREVKHRLGVLANGDVAAALEWASELASQKDELRLKLSLIRIAARRHMLIAAKDGQQADTLNHPESWGYLLDSIMDAERAIFERNLSALYVLQFLLSQFVSSFRNVHTAHFPAPVRQVVS